MQKARHLLDEKKARDLLVLDVRGISSITDFFLIATGTSAPHLKALAQELDVELKSDGIRCLHNSGTAESGWIVNDFVDVVVHLFTEEVRSYYDLEGLWKDGKVVAAPA